MHRKPLPSAYIFVRLRKEKGRQEKARKAKRLGEGKENTGEEKQKHPESSRLEDIPCPPPLQFTSSLDNYNVAGLATWHYSRNCRYRNKEHRVCPQEAPSLGGVGEKGTKRR